MAENVGRVDVLVDVDGKLLDERIRALGQRAGRQMARSLSKEFNISMRQATQLTNKWGQALNRTERAVNRLDRSVLKLWKTLPHGFRQFNFYVALFANLAEGIATLSSAAGAGILVFGGAFTSLGIGVGTAVAAFQNLTGEIEDLPEEVRATARAFQGLGDEFGNLQKAIQVRALRNADAAFDSLRDTVKQLTPAFEEVADHVGVLVDDLAKGLKPGTKNFNNLNTLIKNSGPIFERIARSVGRFGEALLTVFASPAMNRAINEFQDWIDVLIERFDEFANSDALDTWFSNASRIFGAVGGLLDATGRALNDLVTPESIDRLVALLGHMEDFIPRLGTMLEILGELDIFGLIAQLLDDFSAALAPLAEPLRDFAEGVNKVISAGIDQLAGPIGDAAAALAPFVQGLADFINANPEAIAAGLIGIATAAVVLKGAQGLAGLPGIVTRAKDSLQSLGKVNFRNIAGGLSLIIGSMVASEMFSPASEQDATQKAQTYWSNVLTGGVLGAMSAGPFGAALGVAVAAVATSIQQNSEQLGKDIEEAITSITEGEYWNDLGERYSVLGEQWDIFIGKWENGALQIQTFANTVGLFFQGIAIGIETFLTDTEVNFANWRDGVITGWNDFWAGFGATVNLWVVTIAAALAAWWLQVTTGFVGWWAEVTAGWNSFWAGFGTAVSDAWNFITSWIATQMGRVWSIITGTIGQIGAVWNSFWAGVGSFFSGVWNGIVSAVRGAANTIIGIVNGIISSINRVLDSISSLSGGLIDLNIPSLPKMATGGITMGPSIAGEAGPELVVPLTGPISNMNPAAQPFARMIRGGSSAVGGGPSRITTVEAGAIVVQTIAPPMQVASAVLDRLVANAAV